MEQRELDLSKSNEEQLKQLKKFDPNMGEEELRKIRQALIDSGEGIPFNMDNFTIDKEMMNIYNFDCDKLLKLLSKANITANKLKGFINLNETFNPKIKKVEEEIEKDNNNILGQNASKILKGISLHDNAKIIYIETKKTDTDLYYFLSSVDDQKTENYIINGKEFQQAISEGKEKITTYRTNGKDNGLLFKELGITNAKMKDGYPDNLEHYGLNEYYDLPNQSKKML